MTGSMYPPKHNSRLAALHAFCYVTLAYAVESLSNQLIYVS